MTASHPLRSYRESQDPPLSQEALARLLGVNRGTIIRWEAGERFPDREYWPRIQQITGVTAAELANAASSPPSQHGEAAA